MDWKALMKAVMFAAVVVAGLAAVLGSTHVWVNFVMDLGLTDLKEFGLTFLPFVLFVVCGAYVHIVSRGKS